MAELQQYLPFTVLKPSNTFEHITDLKVATVLTVYGIETLLNASGETFSGVATVLTVYGIETRIKFLNSLNASLSVATVLTVYGIETL